MTHEDLALLFNLADEWWRRHVERGTQYTKACAGPTYAQLSGKGWRPPADPYRNAEWAVKTVTKTVVERAS